MQKFLTTCDIVDEPLCFREPCLVALEEKTNSIERHAWLLVEPRVVGIHVEEETIHAQGKVTVQKRLDAGGCLVPYATNLCESLSLNDILAIYVSSTDGIQHVVGLIVGG